jgi:hypothetical protein
MKRIAHYIALLAFLFAGFSALAQNTPSSKAPQYRSGCIMAKSFAK